jgi:hypothetical protein
MAALANDLSGLADAIRDARGTGWTWIAMVERAGDSDVDAIERILNVVELGTPASGWNAVGRGDAAEIIARFLYQPIPLAVELMSFPRSTEFAATFIDAFTADARFVTNLTDPPSPMGGWSPVTAHTFDACVIALDVSRVGVICVADED